MKDKIFEEMYDVTEIRGILDHPAFLSLSMYRHHGKQSRLLHVVAVAELVFVVSRLRGLDVISATRAALLHDFYFYDRSVENKKGHLKRHPIIALQNAVKYFQLNDIEKDAVIHHMWPLTPIRPGYKESRLVSMADKATTLIDVRISAGIGMRNARFRFRPASF